MQKIQAEDEPYEMCLQSLCGQVSGFKVHKEGISVDEDKIKAIRDMKALSNIKEL